MHRKRREAQKSPLFWRFLGAFAFLRITCSRKPLHLIKSPSFTNAPCKTAYLYNAPSMHFLGFFLGLRGVKILGFFEWFSLVFTSTPMNGRSGFRRCLERPLGEYDPLGVRPTGVPGVSSRAIPPTWEVYFDPVGTDPILSMCI